MTVEDVEPHSCGYNNISLPPTCQLPPKSLPGFQNKMHFAAANVLDVSDVTEVDIQI